MTTLLGPRAAYELWAESYPASAHNPLMQAEQTIVARLLTHTRVVRALDVGTGSGRYLPILASTAASVVGVDLSMAMLRAAGGYTRLCADGCRLPFRRASFDLVNASLMVGDVADVAVWTAEASRVLTRGGHLVYSDFHPTWSDNGWQRTFRDGDGRLHAVAFHPHSLDQHLEALNRAGFDVLAIREPRLKVGRGESPVLAIFHAVKSVGGLR